MMMTAADLLLHDELGATDNVLRVDTARAALETELDAHRGKLAAFARDAARARMAGETPGRDVSETLARIAELEAVRVAFDDLRIVAEYRSLLGLANDAEKRAAGLLEDANRYQSTWNDIRAGKVDFGKHAGQSHLLRADALHHAEAQRVAAMGARGAELEGAHTYRRRAAEIKRGSAALFAAEGVA